MRGRYIPGVDITHVHDVRGSQDLRCRPEGPVAWRSQYGPFMRVVRGRHIPSVDITHVHDVRGSQDLRCRPEGPSHGDHSTDRSASRAGDTFKLTSHTSTTCGAARPAAGQRSSRMATMVLTVSAPARVTRTRTVPTSVANQAHCVGYGQSSNGFRCQSRVTLVHRSRR